ncbi:hypothetical protein N836_33270 [Leptolyngbya sp. Heron Island J]|uniref:hypothetical protein n=1 Tax=Leptolyngbya sp. Heron Island J TaxID=1385935 RepID=UPI0003B9802D|nr:hypothetical protein [Leptolyngbya sp. Heron Island J]ESA38302.1 hypothetical protein N836_33270 [Leptolyngbya sp. Heron Island J]
MAELNVEVPCVELPELPEIPQIQLFGGVSLNGFLDFSAGVPNQCSANFSLIQQLAPTLASMTIVLKILAVLKALQAAAESAFLDSGDLLVSLVDLAPIFVSLTPAGMAVTIAGMLRLIISFLNCFILQLEASVKFQANIAELQAQADLDPVSVSPVLTASLSCAQANAELSLEHVMASLGPVQPLIEMITLVADIAGIPLELSLDVSASADSVEMISSLKETVSSIEATIEALPV